jgi:hypothetical protein
MAILLTVFVEGLISESSAWAHNVTVSTTFLVQAYIADLFWVHVVTVSSICSKNGINIGDSAEVQGVKVSTSDNDTTSRDVVLEIQTGLTLQLYQFYIVSMPLVLENETLSML